MGGPEEILKTVHMKGLYGRKIQYKVQRGDSIESREKIVENQVKIFLKKKIYTIKFSLWLTKMAAIFKLDTIKIK